MKSSLRPATLLNQILRLQRVEVCRCISAVNDDDEQVFHDDDVLFNGTKMALRPFVTVVFSQTNRENFLVCAVQLNWTEADFGARNT